MVSETASITFMRLIGKYIPQRVALVGRKAGEPASIRLLRQHCRVWTSHLASGQLLLLELIFEKQELFGF